MAKYIRKTKDVYCIETNCGYGWECECEFDTYEEAKSYLPEYRTYINRYNGVTRIKKRRERI